LKDLQRAEVEQKAKQNAEERVLDALVGSSASPSTRESFREKLKTHELDDREIEIEVNPAAGTGQPLFEIPGQPGAGMGMINLSEMLGKAMGGRGVKRKVKVAESFDLLLADETDKLLDQDALRTDAIELVENHGIVFLDEIDKITNSGMRGGADVSREGVQRDLLPLIEGTTVSTKYGPVKTDHILFIASGAFAVSKPSDLLPELQGRLPIRVELKALTRDDLIRILNDTEVSVIKQYAALIGTEGVKLEFTPDGIEAIADAAVKVNETVENIGARRLSTIMERLVEELSFEAPDKQGQTVTIDKAYVEAKVGALAGNTDLSKFVL
jgi:ATP-dependent HslUV protease ATP-binding subunit HslU